MTTQTAPAAAPMLAHRRFAVRFLGRPGAWLWFAGTGVVAAAAWALVALPARGVPSAQRSWYLWSGNVVLLLFVATMAFVARKWSIKLAYFRNFGRAPAERADACWAAIQELNAKIRKGAFAGDAEIRAAADETLARFGVAKIQRAELRSIDVGGKRVVFVQLAKKEPFGRLEPWLEMHMGVGVVACVGVLLHADFALRHPIGWSLFLLSMIVLVTGLVGAVLYRVVPEKLVKADAGIPYEEAGVARENYQSCIEGVIATLDEKLRPAFAPLLAPAATPQALAERATSVMREVAASNPQSADIARDLVVMAGSRDNLIWSTAPARRYDFWLRLWRWVHAPVSVILFFLIALHVWVVVWY
jgi:hypothetical protein